ncbi:MAG TPA: RpiB/LacA/LacB family sugar-phosphate isomerase [Anaerolineaceae bacterium]|nr:RpiB/LacA/LacB family sugar-phosphate isomerase [Anaerolineaceae bacterium]
MKVAVAVDHGGFPLKEAVLETVRSAGHEPIDLGTFTPDMIDYPEITQRAGHAIQQGQAERAVVVCGSGVGACVAANKMKGIYAAICHDTYSAHQGVEHDNMNILCLGARIIGPELAKELIAAFLQAQFSTVERYRRRFGEVQRMEKGETI